ncbi:MAG: 50S ribosomal protein L15, partial [Trueperaceae bacterium]
MKINDLKPAVGSKKSRRRVGRGLGSGRGKTAGRGQKGQSSRSGFSQGSGWEGGRSRLVMRLPKRGFTRERELYQLVNLEDLHVFEEGALVNAESLAMRGLVRHIDRPVKLLGRGELTVAGLIVEVDAASRSAASAVAANGGTVRGAAVAEPEGEAGNAGGADDSDSASSAGSAEGAAEVGAAEQSTAKKSAAKDSTAKQSAAEKSPAKESPAKDSTAKKSAAKKRGAAGGADTNGADT